MQPSQPSGGPILRLFEVKAKAGCAETLLQKFATTSAEVVSGQPGNAGYFFGQGLAGAEDVVVFASLWRDMDAVKARFGADWLSSYLPPGYEDLIESCSVRHLDLSAGWHVQLDE
ncbi:MAG: antibiotic biosynthesis monooxygenase [Pseudomonadota bacterium]